MAVKRHDNQNPHIVLVKVEEFVPEKPLFTREEMIEYASNELGYESIGEIEEILGTIPGYVGIQEECTRLMSDLVGRDCPNCCKPLYWLEFPTIDNQGIECFKTSPGCYHCHYHE